MNIDEALIARIVTAVIKTLAAQGLLNLPDGNAVPAYGCGVPRPRPLGGAGTGTGGGAQAGAGPRPGSAVLGRPGNGRRAIVTEETVREYVKKGVSVLNVPADALITPLAADTAKEKGVRLVKGGA